MASSNKADPDGADADAPSPADAPADSTDVPDELMTTAAGSRSARDRGRRERDAGTSSPASRADETDVPVESADAPAPTDAPDELMTTAVGSRSAHGRREKLTAPPAMPASTVRTSRVRAVARWLGPSIVAGATGAVAAGVWEGLGLGSMLAIAAAAGFVTMVAWPILVAASALTRGLWAAWQPSELGVIEADGGAPRLAGWLGVVWLGMIALGWALFQGTWMLANATAFKPMSLSFAEPVLGIAAFVAIVAISRPLARGLTWLLRKVNARWRLTVRRILIGLAIETLVLVYLLWRFFIRRRLGPVDLSLVHAPLIGLVATAVVQAAWGRLGNARRVVGPVLGGLAVAALVAAVVAWRTAPSTTLAIWGDRPLAGLAIDRIFNLDKIRARISLAEFQPVAIADSPHPDIILITIDTVRADHTPPYGGTAEMPLLRDLGTKGAVFDWAFSPSNVTRRSIPSMLTGLAPNRVHGRVVGWSLRLDPRHVMLQERLEAGGYDTAGFVCCYGFYGDDFRTGWQRGFEHLEIEPTGMKLAGLGRAWLEKREASGTHKPLFLWMHILEPHNWQQGFGVPTNDEERKKFYDRALTQSDAMIVELLGALANRDPGRAPIVIITADHGEALGEHGHPYHSTDLYNSQIHVPLVIAGPGIKPQHIPETVSLTDLTPTVLELAGFEAPKGASIDGHSFADLAQGRRIPDPDKGVAFAAMIRDRSNPGGIEAVVRGGWKLIETADAAELYHVVDDPNEKTNLVSARAGMYNELVLLMQQYQAKAKASPFE